jgi:outer membrane protein OmpA-like peptidoglycan-associated protein
MGFSIVGLSLLVASCATTPKAPEAIVLGEDVCAGEATRIYFPHGESVLNPLAAQVVVRVQDHGPPSRAKNLEERAAIVRQILVSRGVAENRISATAEGPMVDQVPKGPIGGVLIFTRP